MSLVTVFVNHAIPSILSVAEVSELGQRCQDYSNSETQEDPTALGHSTLIGVLPVTALMHLTLSCFSFSDSVSPLLPITRGSWPTGLLHVLQMQMIPG